MYEKSIDKSTLLVEDEQIIASASSHKLKSFGYDVITAKTGE